MSLDVCLTNLQPVTVFDRSVTHNLTEMADAAGIYQAIWHPDQMGITKVAALIPLLQAGLKKLLENPEEFKQYEPDNGWGSYSGLVSFVTDYLNACEEYPQADISLWR